MNTPNKSNTVSFTTKGQIVIPAWLRKEYQISAGTKAVVESTPAGILLKPVTAALIRRGRGVIAKKPGDAPMTQWWARLKDGERAIEAKKLGRRRS